MLLFVISPPLSLNCNLTVYFVLQGPNIIVHASQLDGTSRFKDLRFATLSEKRRIVDRLVLELPDGDLHHHHGVVEVYLTRQLHKIRHGLENHGPRPSYVGTPSEFAARPLWIIPDSGAYQHRKGVFAAARIQSSHFKKAFGEEAFRQPWDEIFQFMFDEGANDPSRSDGWRYDIQNGGRDTDPKTRQPAILCGDKKLRDHKFGESVRTAIGELTESLCNCAKSMTIAEGWPHVIHHSRFTDYAQHLSSFLFAKGIFGELITLQLMNLTVGHGGFKHFDLTNDPRESYDRCFALVS